MASVYSAKIRKTGLSLIATFLLHPITPVFAEAKLNIYTENYPPYNMSSSGAPYAHKEEEITGLCTDIVKALVTKAKIDYRLKLRNWSQGLKRAQTKANHAIFCAARTEEREKFFQWVGPLTNIDWTLFALKGSSIKLASLEEAKQYKIGGYKDDVMSLFLIEKGYTVNMLTNDSLNPRKLQLGQIDLWVSDGLAGPYVASELEEPVEVVPVLKFRATPLFMAVNKDTDAETMNLLQTTFKKMQEAGEVEAISKSYVP